MLLIIPGQEFVYPVDLAIPDAIGGLGQPCVWISPVTICGLDLGRIDSCAITAMRGNRHLPAQLMSPDLTFHEIGPVRAHALKACRIQLFSSGHNAGLS